MNYEYFHEALRYHLEKAGRGSQAAVCRQTGIPRSYLSRIVNSERRAGRKTQEKIAGYFNFPLPEFLEMGRALCLGEDPGASPELLERMSEGQLIDRLVTALRKEMATARMLGRTQLMYESIVENSRHIILRINDGLRITFANPAAAVIFAKTRKALESLSLFDLIDSTYHAPLKDQIDSVATGGGTFTLEAQTTQPKRWLALDVTVFREISYEDRGQILGVDITDRKQLMDTLFFIQHGVDKSYVPTLWIASDAQIAYVNEAVCTLLGYSREELLQLHVWDINPLIPENSWQEKWVWFRKHGKVTFAGQYRTKEGVIIPVEFQVSNLEYPDGRRYNVVFVKTEIN